MLFEDELPEDKGLFTFYRQQAENEEQIRLKRKLRKQLKKMYQDKQLKDLPQIQPPKELSQLKTPTVAKANSIKQKINKAKPPVFKQRLIESVVDMGQQIQAGKQKTPDLKPVKTKESTYVLKSRRYNQKISDLNLSNQHNYRYAQDESVHQQLRIEPLHCRNSSQQLASSRIKPAIHSNRGSVELPGIRKVQEQKQLQSKPRKGIKSRFIEQALRTKDRDKIRNMRKYIKGRSSFQFSDQQLNEDCKSNTDSVSFQAFKVHQQRLSSVLKKLKRRL